MLLSYKLMPKTRPLIHILIQKASILINKSMENKRSINMATTDLWELEPLKQRRTIGYRDWTDKTGKHKRSIVMEHEALLNTFDIGLTYLKLVNHLTTTGNLPPSWNNHDHTVMTGFLQHIGPYDVKINNKLCNFLDPIEDQLKKHCRAIQKLHAHVEQTKVSLKEYYTLMGIDKPTRQITKKESFDHCEQRRKLEQSCIQFKDDNK